MTISYLRNMQPEFEPVIGLEVHIQLLTKSKLFCGDSTQFGASPNTQVSAISLAHPGTLPRMNREAIEYAVKLGLVFHCGIQQNNYFARKNYFYPDLPKGYQVSQHTTPICKNGYVTIETENGTRDILLNRIHIEEDAGKSIHDLNDDYSCIDLNRAGVPLLEMVTEPNLYSAEEAFAFLTEVRKIVRYLGICDGNMEEGSLRCDANISIRKKGRQTLGTKVEVKNLNSIRNVRKAIEVEVERMKGVVSDGGTIQQETRSFDAEKNTSFSLRSKEEANDYRYFPEPDLTPFVITDAMLNKVRSSIPVLPSALLKTYTEKYQLSHYDAKIISDDKATADYFNSLVVLTSNYKAAANWLSGPVRSWLNEHDTEIGGFPLDPSSLASLISLIDEGKVSFSIASSKIFPVMIESGDSPLQIANDLNLIQEKDSDALISWIDQVISTMPEKVSEYKKGKKGLIGLFAGEVKKLSGGKADMQVVNKLLIEKLN